MSGTSSIPHGRRAAAAIRRLQRGDDFDSWRDIALDVAEGRQWVIQQSGTTDHRSAAYRQALAQWEQRNPWSQAPELAHPITAYLRWWADHIAEVDSYRAALTDAEKTRFNHPSTIYKALHGQAASAGGGLGRRGGSGGSGSRPTNAQIAALQAEIAHRDRKIANLESDIAAYQQVVQSTRDAYDHLEAETADRIADLERQLAGGVGLSGYPTFPLLWLNGGCTVNRVNAAKRRMARACHPDHGGSDEQMTALNLEVEGALAAAAATPARGRRRTP